MTDHIQDGTDEARHSQRPDHREHPTEGETMSKPIHYAGRIDHASGLILAGWAACCSGERAANIRARGQHTYARDEVTCKACLKMIARGDEYKAERGK
jgi:hypothetical protein